jgi:hypothetical protein
VWEHILDSKDSSHPRDNTEAAGSRAGFQVLGAAFFVALGDFRGPAAFSGLGGWAPAFSGPGVSEPVFRAPVLWAPVLWAPVLWAPAFSGPAFWAPAFSALTVLETAFRSGALRAAVFAASP